MRRVNIFHHVGLAVCVISGAGFGSLTRCLGQQEKEIAEILLLEPAPVAGVATRESIPTSIRWAGKEYEVSEGVEILIQVCSGSDARPNERADALRKLSAVGPILQGTASIPRLVALHEVITQLESKRALIGCVAASNDPRGLPLFADVLANTTDEIERFQAAYALARWNVRDGVRELIGLFESATSGPDGQRLAEEMVKVFQLLSLQKGWGAPDQEILQRIRENKPGLTKEQVLSRYTSAMKEWFATNEHRFPDWKLGDPPPEASSTGADDVNDN